jgi:ElaB/YqjD/DUF883 family membrane-anchored ribosome-binding protein
MSTSASDLANAAVTQGAVTTPAPTTDYVAAAEAWVQQNSMLAIGIAAALVFFMSRKGN